MGSPFCNDPLCASAHPKAFSPSNDALQVAWDATSLSDLLFCPQFYKYTHIDGWKGSQTDLEFGAFAASGFETYYKARLAGVSKDDAIVAALDFILRATWPEDGPMWGGRYETQWRCKGETKYRNAKGNAAKCPYSHKGMWFPEPEPHICGECGSGIETAFNFVSDHPTKNRETLIRLVVWYCLEQPENLEDGLHPYQFPDGTPAVELSFRLPLPWKSPYGDQYILSGHIDHIGELGAGEDAVRFPVDQKTTTKTIGPSFFDGYAPHMGLDTYDLAGSLLFPDLNLQGVMVDGAQTMVNGAAFGRHIFYKSDEQRQEHLDLIEFAIRGIAEPAANSGYWPMFKSSCWKCPFKRVCAAPPEDRERRLKEQFTKGERWNPLIERK